jgi:hypothetical protein
MSVAALLDDASHSEMGLLAEIDAELMERRSLTSISYCYGLSDLTVGSEHSSRAKYATS